MRGSPPQHVGVARGLAIGVALVFALFPAVAGAASPPRLVDTGGNPFAMACPSVSQCTLVDDSGQAVTFNPAKGGTRARTATVDPHHTLYVVACPSRSQ